MAAYSELQIVAWLTHSFNTRGLDENLESLEIAFKSLRDGSELWVTVTPEAGGTVRVRGVDVGRERNADGVEFGQVRIFTDAMETAGVVVQDLCAYLKVRSTDAAGMVQRGSWRGCWRRLRSLSPRQSFRLRWRRSRRC